MHRNCGRWAIGDGWAVLGVVILSEAKDLFAPEPFLVAPSTSRDPSRCALKMRTVLRRACRLSPIAVFALISSRRPRRRVEEIPQPIQPVEMFRLHEHGAERGDRRLIMLEGRARRIDQPDRQFCQREVEVPPS